MLANLLAVVIGLGSLTFYLAAFILPEVHRRSDFFWSGVGMFYAVVLWYCARQMNGAVLLGQTASVGLLLWLGYQTLLLRRMTTPAAQQTPIQLGNSERHRPASRTMIKDYEFVEDGVDDSLAEELDPDSPVVIQPTADEFAPKIVVPAAIPKPALEEEAPEEIPTADTSDNSTAPNPVKTRERPNPVAAVGIFVGWLKEVITPKTKEPKPMIELPPRPPSIPNISKTDLETDLETSLETDPKIDADVEADAPSDSASPSTVIQKDDEKEEEEDSNWPDEDFWD